MQTKEQKRAEFCLKKIESLGDIDEKKARFIVGTPTIILTNGLGQAMAFWLSKKKDKHDDVFKIVRDWLKQNYKSLASDKDIDFLKKIASLKQKDYIQAQNETIALLQWLKRYARAFQVEKEEK